MIDKIRKAVFPAAGLATRLLPATRAVPKAMLTLVGRPVIEYVVDEARTAGIEHFIFVVGANGTAIEKHFRGADMSSGGAISFVPQETPLGFGHAVWCARHLIGDEAFAVLSPDAIMRGEPGCLTQILDTYFRTGGNVVSIEEVGAEETGKYGIVGIGEGISKDAFRITSMVEKPKPGSAPSNLKISGRYILQPEILACLARQETGAGGEIQLTDALIRLAEKQTVFGHRFRGRSFDCGSKEGLVAANVAFALDDPRLAPLVKSEIERRTG